MKSALGQTGKGFAHFARPDRAPLARRALASVVRNGLAFVVVVAAACVAHADYQVSGVFLYTDREFTLGGFTGNEPSVPIRLADVQIVDNSTQQVLASGATDVDGAFSVSVVDNQTRDIVVRVLTSSNNTSDLFITVRHTTTRATYAVAHPVLTSHDPNTDIDFTSAPIVAVPGMGGDPFNIFDVTLDAMNLLGALNGSRPGAADAVTMYWALGTANGTYYSPSTRSAFLLGLSFDSDGYDDSIILHELGHYAEFEFFDTDTPGGAHTLNRCHDMRLTWSEGWSTFFQMAVRNAKGLNRPEIYVDTTGRPGPGGAFISYEMEGPSLGNLGSGNEVAVSTALWEIVDDASTPDGSPGIDDDALQLADGLARIWDVLVNSVRTATHISVEDFWDGWFARGHGLATEMQSAFAAQGMEFFADALEPDDDAASARVVTSAGTTHHTIFGSGDEDWSRLTVVSGGSVPIPNDGPPVRFAHATSALR